MNNTCISCKYYELRCIATQMDGEVTKPFCRSLWIVVPNGFCCNRYEKNKKYVEKK